MGLPLAAVLESLFRQDIHLHGCLLFNLGNILINPHLFVLDITSGCWSYGSWYCSELGEGLEEDKLSGRS